jgi:hypothetical protein
VEAFKVTIPFKKKPWYTVNRVEAVTKAAAIDLVINLAIKEVGDHPFKKPVVKEVL